MAPLSLLLSFGAGLLAGLASIAHCALMCGPLACSVSAGEAFGRRAGKYQVGRTLGYGVLGAVVGSAGDVVVRTFGGSIAGALVSWVFAAALGALALRLWRIDRAPSQSLGNAAAGRTVPLRTERGRPTLTERLVGFMPKEPLLLGAATALLPCGALYGALGLAAASATAPTGALLMVGFATASGFGLVSTAWLARRVGQRVPPVAMRVAAVVFALAAVFFAIRPAATLAQPEESPPCCAAME